MLLKLGAHKFQEGDFFTEKTRTTQFSVQLEVLGWLGAI